ncbi:MAG: hypothetical protein OEV42_14820 [Deltaproteobacteria bacterium]|nr:hypothetical protein [Deltaproteobacteria bacterium]
MTTQINTLNKIFNKLILPLEEKIAMHPVWEGKRSGDPLWQIGHAAFDTMQALILPFNPQYESCEKFKEQFSGKNANAPWSGSKPIFKDVRDLWSNILRDIRAVEKYNPHDLLPSPIIFAAYTVHNVGEALDYSLFHTSFHFGRAYEILGDS